MGTPYRQLLHRELLQTLSADDAIFRNSVLCALTSHLGSTITVRVPLAALGLPAATDSTTDSTNQTVAVVAKGRTACEVLVSWSPNSKLVPLHYTAILRHASFEAVLALAVRVEHYMVRRTALNDSYEQAAPRNAAFALLNQVLDAALKHLALVPVSPDTPGRAEPRSPRLVGPVGPLTA